MAKIGSWVSVVSFAGTVAVVQAPTQNREDILVAIDRFQLQRGIAMDLKKVCQGLSARLIFEKRQSEITASLDTLLAQWTAQFTEVSASAAKRAWARLIKQVYEADPLMCPRCTGPMRIIAFIEQPEVIEKILTHLGLWPAQSHSPPAGVPVALSPATGLFAA